MSAPPAPAVSAAAAGQERVLQQSHLLPVGLAAVLGVHCLQFVDDGSHRIDSTHMTVSRSPSKSAFAMIFEVGVTARGRVVDVRPANCHTQPDSE